MKNLKEKRWKMCLKEMVSRYLCDTCFMKIVDGSSYEEQRNKQGGWKQIQPPCFIV